MKPQLPPDLPSARAGRSVAATRQLDRYQNSGFSPGRGWLVRCLWYFASLVFFESGILPASAPKRSLLRVFGAQIGPGVVIKPHVRIKYPWRLTTGAHTWIGEEVWIDNLAQVTLGNHVCLSQRTYLCTGSHDDTSETFELVTAPITIQDGVWIATGVTVLGGVTVGAMATVCACSLVAKDLPAACRCAGIPARPLASAGATGTS